MTEITRISLENEMDVVVAQKRMMGVAQYFSLSLSTQTTIATAVAEICRVVVDRTDQGCVAIGMEKKDAKFFLYGRIFFPADTWIQGTEAGFKYAQLLVPEFNIAKDEDSASIAVEIGIPRNLGITVSRIKSAIDFFKAVAPETPYEKLKLRYSDLTQRAEEKEEALRHSRLLDEKKNEFISIASHELKTPLTTIIAFTKLALNAGAAEDPAKVMRYLDKIDTQARKLHILIQQLLDISKVESGKLNYDMADIDWNGYLDEIVPILEHMVPYHKVTWDRCEEDVIVCIDAQRMEQVFANLMNNAAKYSEPSTSIHIGCQLANDVLTVCVRDEGIGISKDSMDRIFEKYFREPAVQNKYSGFGMGLYITANIVREHRGKIWAERNQQAGSTFYFTLPVSRA
jgi:signal transduction histidine kinase